MPPTTKTILHVDMDAFFAQVEMMRDPKLKGKPLCVGGIPGTDRSVVTSASYEARKFGVHAGMPLLQAKRQCPNAIFVRSRGHAYITISRRIVGILHEYCDQVEPSSIDESYLDIGGVLAYWGGAEKIGQGIKDKVKEHVGLTCTVGIAPTRTLAKMATNMEKPDGLTIITPDIIEEKIFPLSVRAVPGIGEKTEKRLHEIGIHTCGQLANAVSTLLDNRIGLYGRHLQDVVRGKVDWDVTKDEDRSDEKSIGNSRTFSADTNDMQYLKGYLLSLIQMVGRRMRAAEMSFRTVTITIRYGDFHTVTHRKSIGRATNDEDTMFKLAWQLFQEYYITGMPVRLL
ncbi:MAG: DNA polymerase IV, partial [bacterium]